MALGASSITAGPPDPAEIERLLRQLGSEKFVQREAATAALDKIGEPALENRTPDGVE